MLPEPVARPPSLLPIVNGNVAVTLPVLRSIRDTLGSPQFGTQRLPKPTVNPEHGFLPTAIVSTILLAFGSMRVTVCLGEFETQKCSSIACQSGTPGTSKTLSGFSFVIGIRK